MKGPSLAYPADLDGWLARVAIAGPVVEAGAQASDQIRRLTDISMAAVHEQGLMRLLLPRAGGGAQVATAASSVLARALNGPDKRKPASQLATIGSSTALQSALQAAG